MPPFPRALAGISPACTIASPKLCDRRLPRTTCPSFLMPSRASYCSRVDRRSSISASTGLRRCKVGRTALFFLGRLDESRHLRLGAHESRLRSKRERPYHRGRQLQLVGHRGYTKGNRCGSSSRRKQARWFARLNSFGPSLYELPHRRPPSRPPIRSG
jgi:hypothetical protein